MVKNKHLVLLFLVVLAAGFLSRYLPWPYRHFFQTTLIRIDPNSLDWISVIPADGLELQFKKTDQGWVAEQNKRTVLVADSVVNTWIQPLFAMESIRSVSDAALDSSGLKNGTPLFFQLRTANQQSAQITLGRVVVENGAPATFVQIDLHVGIFLVKGDLRSQFSTNLNAFRQRGLFTWPVQQFQACAFNGVSMAACNLQRNDTLQLWQNSKGNTITVDSFLVWLQRLASLNTAPFADQFDPLEHPDAMLATVDLYTPKDSVCLRFYGLPRPVLPEDPGNYSKQSASWATYFVHSSQNKGNFFAIQDTALARVILAGPDHLMQPLRDTLIHATRSIH